MSIEKVKVLWVNNAKEPIKQRVVAARYFLGIEVGCDELWNQTGEMLRLDQVVFSDGTNVVGLVNN